MDIKSKVPLWSDDYMTGISEIDFQHQYFLGLIARVEKRFIAGMDSYLTSRHFNEILEYASFHFTSEENIMLLYNYPEIKLHQEQHKDLLEEIATFLCYYNNGKKTADEIIEMLVKWFLEHTIKEDSKFSNFFKSLNLSIDI